MINEAIGLGKINVGKGTFGHITHFMFPSSVTFQSVIWEGTSVLIPKPAPGSIETLSGIVLCVHGRETETFFEELGSGLVIVNPMKLFGYEEQKHNKDTAVCTQLPITPAIAMVVCEFPSINFTSDRLYPGNEL